MEVLRRSSVFAAEIMDAFDRSPTDKELVAQAKALGREYVHARLLRAGLSWSAPERAAPVPGRLAEVCAVLLRLGECVRPGGTPSRASPPAGSSLLRGRDGGGVGGLAQGRPPPAWDGQAFGTGPPGQELPICPLRPPTPQAPPPAACSARISDILAINNGRPQKA
ncbi:hypothetical protein P7K49_013216 [Saguinus oedipus]|uniref:Bcl-2-related ovarian killer protein n=1 Tax=Saguinus oedipus TaxID=9490 RepID=A0ABQ9VFV0_SAGOE|nr:hypothetical protein P7K49_013216 [Saguinus oedipus]